MSEMTTVQAHTPIRPGAVYCDRIVELEPGVRGVGIKSVSINDSYFQGLQGAELHMPHSWLTEAIGQVGIVVLLGHEANRDKRGLLLGIESFEYFIPVKPGDQLRMEFRIHKMRDKFGKGSGYATVNGQIVARGELLYSWN